MGKKGKRGANPAEKKAVLKRLDALAKELEKELEGADLFAPLPPTDDCPICLVRLPRLKGFSYYQGCCGKDICLACSKENERVIEKMNGQIKGNAEKKKIERACPFCRDPQPRYDVDPDGYIRQLELRVPQGDASACSVLANLYQYGFKEDANQRDCIRALQYFIQAIELGCEEACTAIALCLHNGEIGLPVDMIKSRLFFRVGALRGQIQARHKIGLMEYDGLGNHELGIRHWKVSASAGYQDSLNRLRDIFNAEGKLPGKEFISKEELDSLYRMCHEVQEEVKTDEREKYLSMQTMNDEEVLRNIC